MYVIGGSNSSRILGEGNSKVRTYSIKSDSWTEMRTNGPEPSSSAGHSFLQNSHYIYLVGGESDLLSRLDLRNMVWSSIRIPGLIGRSRGCLAYYNGHLIHAFGLSKDKPVINTQFIELKAGKIVPEIPVEGELEWSTIFLVFAIIVGVLIFLVLSFVTFYERKKKRERDVLRPPSILTEHVWADANTRKSYLVDFDNSDTIDCDVSSQTPPPSIITIPGSTYTKDNRPSDSKSIPAAHSKYE
ncbi:hypothetical protein DSO57_1032778 [Entomophthora muscae]|uniref:Uncharacterized protein n=1 Tax=Entomophthora muscae TaxID=34485 RepID=A0ACC2UKS8_9FUNG|nr:hypothetical protein DSO57_1032778 [Entomophthora muscae]